MSAIDQGIALPRSLFDYCEARDEIREQVRSAYEILNQADNHMRLFSRIGLSSESKPRHQLDESLRDVDREFWRRAFNVTGFMQIMDAKAVREFMDEVSGNQVPEFTSENVQTTFTDLYQNRVSMFRRGVAELFRRLSGKYKSNGAFKIEDRMVVTCAIVPSFRRGLEINYRESSEINDLDRVLSLMNGEEHEPRRLESAINEALLDPPHVYEDERLKLRGFKNGNAHIWIKQQWMRDKINQMIADHYGQVLGQPSRTNP